MRRKVNRSFRIASPKSVRDAMNDRRPERRFSGVRRTSSRPTSSNVSITVLGAHLSNSESPRDATDSVFWIAGDEMVNIKLSGVGRVNARTSQVISMDDASLYFRLGFSRLRLFLRTSCSTILCRGQGERFYQTLTSV